MLIGYLLYVTMLSTYFTENGCDNRSLDFTGLRKVFFTVFQIFFCYKNDDIASIRDVAAIKEIPETPVWTRPEFFMVR